MRSARLDRASTNLADPTLRETPQHHRASAVPSRTFLPFPPVRLCRFSDGRGRDPTAHVPGDFAADRRTTAAASACAGLRRSIGHALKSNRREECVQNPRENGQISCSPTVSGCPRYGSGPRHPPVLPERRKTQKFALVRGSYGESQVRTLHPVLISIFALFGEISPLNRF